MGLRSKGTKVGGKEETANPQRKKFPDKRDHDQPKCYQMCDAHESRSRGRQEDEFLPGTGQERVRRGWREEAEVSQGADQKEKGEWSCYGTSVA